MAGQDIVLIRVEEKFDMVYNCYVCQSELSEDTKFEHIIPNAIGGFIKSKKLICNSCNKKFGDGIDFNLSKQLNYISSMIEIKRDRGQSPAVPTSDGVGFVTPNGNFMRHKPIIRERTVNVVDGHAEIKVDISASNIDEHITSIRKELRKKGISEAGIAEFFIKAQESVTQYYERTSTALTFDLGGDGLRAMAKIASNFYIHTGGDSKYVQQVVSDILGDEEDIPKSFNFYYPANDVVMKDDGEILHSVIVVGDGNEKILYALVELFNFYKCIVLLSNEYEGDDFYRSHFLDIISSPKTVEKVANFALSRVDIDSAINAKCLPFDEIGKEFNKVHAIANDRKNFRQVGDIIERSFRKFPEGVPMNQEMFDEFMKEFMPYAASMISSAYIT